IATFESSPWASKTPIAVEVAIDMPVAGVVVRSRIDAVFPPDQTLPRTTVVDWKSGRPPTSPEQRAAREVQLAIYRLAWATMTSVPVEEVDAAFYYVAEDVTVYPASLLDAAALEAM